MRTGKRKSWWELGILSEAARTINHKQNEIYLFLIDFTSSLDVATVLYIDSNFESEVIALHHLDMSIWTHNIRSTVFECLVVALLLYSRLSSSGCHPRCKRRFSKWLHARRLRAVTNGLHGSHGDCVRSHSLVRDARTSTRMQLSGLARDGLHVMHARNLNLPLKPMLPGHELGVHCQL